MNEISVLYILISCIIIAFFTKEKWIVFCTMCILMMMYISDLLLETNMIILFGNFMVKILLLVFTVVVISVLIIFITRVNQQYKKYMVIPINL